MNVPVMWSFDQFEKNTGIDSFEEHHGIFYKKGWTEILGTNYPHNDRQELYRRYKNWYTLRFSKLGKVLS